MKKNYPNQNTPNNMNSPNTNNRSSSEQRAYYGNEYYTSPHQNLANGNSNYSPSTNRNRQVTLNRKKGKKNRSKKNRLTIIILDILIVLCILAFAYVIGIRYYNNYINDKKTMQLLINQAEGKVDAKTGKSGIWIDPKANPVSGEGGYDTPEGLVDASHQQNNGPVFVEMIGQMTIDKINLNMPIVWGCDYPQLQVGLGWYQKSAEIGNKGNSVILGHRMLEYGRHFNRLNEMNEGDLVRISTKDKNYTYKVKDQLIVSVPEMFNYFDGKDDESELTLVTCTNQGDTRILVRCTLDKTNNNTR